MLLGIRECYDCWRSGAYAHGGMVFWQAGTLPFLCHHWDEAILLTPIQRNFTVCLYPVRIPALF